MALPKELRKALTAKLKDGETLPDEFDDCVYFPNDGAALAFAESKGKAKLKEAQDSAAEALTKTKALETQMADVLKGTGIESPDKIDEFMTKFREAQGSLTEVDKLRNDVKEKDKTIAKQTTQLGELGGFKVQVLKDKALTPLLAKVHADYRDIASELILGKLSIDDKGVVVGPEGKTPESLVDDLVKAKPSFKAPDFKPGPGTGPGGDKTTPAGGAPAGGAPAGGAHQPSTIGDALGAAFKAAQAQAQ